MKKIRPLAACAALALSTITSTALAEDKAVSEGELELAGMLEGHVAGEPQRCISDFASDRMTVIDDTAMVFRSGKTIYVNRTSNAEWLDWSDLPVIERRSGQLCEKDQVELRDRTTFMRGPILFLAEFTPYTKVDEQDTQGE